MSHFSTTVTALRSIAESLRHLNFANLNFKIFGIKELIKAEKLDFKGD